MIPELYQLSYLALGVPADDAKRRVPRTGAKNSKPPARSQLFFFARGVW